MPNIIPTQPFFNPLDFVTGKTIRASRMTELSQCVNHGIANTGTSPVWCQSWPMGLTFAFSISSLDITKDMRIPFTSPRHTLYKAMIRVVSLEEMGGTNTNITIAIEGQVASGVLVAGDSKTMILSLDISALMTTDAAGRVIMDPAREHPESGIVSFYYQGGAFVIKGITLQPVALSGNISNISRERGFDPEDDDFPAHPADPVDSLGMPTMIAGYPLSAAYYSRAKESLEALQRRKRMLFAWTAPRGNYIATRTYGAFSYAMVDKEDICISVFYNGAKDNTSIHIGQLKLELPYTGSSYSEAFFSFSSLDQDGRGLNINGTTQDPFFTSFSDFLSYPMVRPTVFSWRSQAVEDYMMPENTSATSGDAEIFSITMWGVET